MRLARDEWKLRLRPRMSPTPGGIVVKLASVRSFIDLSKIYFYLSSPTQPRYVRLFSHINFTTLKMWAPVKSLSLFSVCPPAWKMSVKEVPMDPEVMVTVDRLVFQYLSGALHGRGAAVSEG